MSRSVKHTYPPYVNPPKRVITLPDEKIVFKPGEGFVIEVPEESE